MFSDLQYESIFAPIEILTSIDFSFLQQKVWQTNTLLKACWGCNDKLSLIIGSLRVIIL